MPLLLCRSELLTVAIGFLVVGSSSPHFCMAQSSVPHVVKMEPPHWWNEGTETAFVLVLNGDNLAECTVSTQAQGIRVLANERRSNSDFLFVRLQIDPDCTPEGKILSLQNIRGQKCDFVFPIHDGNKRPVCGQGVEPGSTMYLIMPDRFANGDVKNDCVEGLLESEINRETIDARHGGDLIGISAQLDYLDALGVDAVWLNPVLLNNQPRWSYHGYAVTDNYNVDPRLGGNDAYKKMIAGFHKRDMRVIQDIILNHWGDNHWMLTPPPDSSWLHHWPEFTLTNYNCNVMTDPHAVEKEVLEFNRGWFVKEMPDLAPHQDAILEDIMIQNALWWISEAGVDGFRIDTYPYSDQGFMASFAERILQQHPNVFLFGECWVSSPSAQSAYLSGSALAANDTYLESIKDFQLFFAIRDMIQESPSWRTGITRVHGILGQDNVYPDPNRLVTFLDNHDTDRWRSAAVDLKKTRYGIGLIMMTRGIPCLYYGTEIGMKGVAAPDGLVRSDFPGGWDGDPRSAFDSGGRSEEEETLWQFTAALGQTRRRYREAFSAPMYHLIPKNGQYHFLRTDGQNHLLILTNASDFSADLDWSQVAPLQNGASICNSLLGQSGDGPNSLHWGEPYRLKPWHFEVFHIQD